MTHRLEDEMQPIVVSMDNQEPEINTPQAGIQDIYVLIVREHEEEEEHLQVVDCTPVLPQKTSMLPAYAICCFSLFLIFSTLSFQCYCIFNPPIATITIIPKSQAVTLSGTVQLGRVLPPLTISQSQITATTGKGHQDARAATGYITLYNGQFQSITIAAGTIFTGARGVPIITDQDATIPAANPPIFGQVIVSAHAISPGVQGNIPAYDINQACCAASVLVKNTQSFYGGQDERTYTTVAQKDINSVSTLLKTTIARSVTGALQDKLKPNEQLQLLPCSPTVTSDHRPGDEASQVKVTASQTCSAVAYNSQELETKAAVFLATQALHKTGAGYSLFGNVHISVKQASVTSSTKPLVFVSFKASGTWIYGLSQQSQQQIKHLIAGKTTQQAMNMLASLSGIEQISIRCSGFGDATRLPKQSSNIHIAFIVV
jgi:VCBS repeat-containing protein